MISNITQKISIEPEYLDNNINNHLLNRIKYLAEGTCTLNNGYIINVNKIKKIVKNIIDSSESLIIFEIVYEATTLKPTIGLILTGTICMILPQGLFVNIDGKMKVLIPSSSMNFKFKKDEYDEYYVNKTGKSKLVNGMDIKIQIIMIKYEQKEFKCIGKII